MLEDPKPVIRLAAVNELQRCIKELDGHSVNKTRQSLIEGIFQTKQFYAESSKISLIEKFAEAFKTLNHNKE